MSHCIYGSDKCPLNPEPSDVQRAQWRRHHKAGTSPGNPKYYRAAALPVPPKSWAGQKPKYPALESGSEYKLRRNTDLGPDPLKEAKKKGDEVRAYVAAYDMARGFKPAYWAPFAEGAPE